MERRQWFRSWACGLGFRLSRLGACGNLNPAVQLKIMLRLLSYIPTFSHCHGIWSLPVDSEREGSKSPNRHNSKVPWFRGQLGYRPES